MLLSTAAHAQWQSTGTLNVADGHYTFLAATPSGDLVAATFNSVGAGDAPKELPAVLIRNPGSSAPTVVELCKFPFDAQRGYGGVTCDAQGNIYLTGDTGNATTSFLRKFLPDGSPDRAFGNGGVVSPGRRCLGVDVVGVYLLMAVDWGVVLVIDTLTGKQLGALAKAPSVYIRDITIDPASMRVFGVSGGKVGVWEGGTPWEPNKYRWRMLSVRTANGRDNSPRAGEGISFDPLTRRPLLTPVPGNQLVETLDDGAIRATNVESASAETHLADTVLSFDGTTLFVSDMYLRKIHLLRRTVGDSIASVSAPVVAAPATRVETAPAQKSPAVQWQNSYEAVVQSARSQNKPMLVYFRSAGAKRCEELENSVLLSDEFNAKAQGFVCVFEDVTKNRLIAYKFGVYQVPHIVLIDSRGEPVSPPLRANLTKDALFSAMQKVR